MLEMRYSPSGMTNGFSVSFLNGDVFMKAAGRCTAKGAGEVKLKAAKCRHRILWSQLLIEHALGRKKRD